MKGVEFGDGFAAARSRGSENNDPFVMEDGRVQTETNHAGGILGGITSGMSVTTPPGDRALQRMPSSIYMNAVFFVTARTAPLLAQ